MPAPVEEVGLELIRLKKLWHNSENLICVRVLCSIPDWLLNDWT